MKNKSFTLIELLVVIVIIGILAGVIIISTSSSIEKANLAKISTFSESLKNSMLLNFSSEWRLDEGSGTVINDSWGANNGTLLTGAIWKSGEDCISGNCIYFPEIGSISIPDSSSFSNLNEVTIELWVKVTTNDQDWEEFFKKGSDRLETAFNGNKGLWLNGTTINFLWQTNKWFHLVYSSSSSSLKTITYLNGDKILDTNSSLLPFDASLLCFGTCSATETFDGFLDEIKIFNSFMPISQIKKEYIAGLDSLLLKGEISKEEYNQRIGKIGTTLFTK